MILQSKSTYILWTKLTPSTAGLKFALSLSTAKNCHRMLPFPLSNTPAKFVILQPSYWTNRYCNFRSKYSNMPTNMLIKHSPLWPICEAKGCCSVSNLWSYPLVLPIGCPLAQMVIQRTLHMPPENEVTIASTQPAARKIRFNRITLHILRGANDIIIAHLLGIDVRTVTAS